MLQIASVPNYTVLMKACSPGGPTKERLGTSPLTLSKDERERERESDDTFEHTHTHSAEA